MKFQKTSFICQPDIAVLTEISKQLTFFSKTFYILEANDRSTVSKVIMVVISLEGALLSLQFNNSAKTPLSECS